MINVKNKWALITGASRGIGKELSIFMAEKGCNLILHSRKKENLSEVEFKVKSLGMQCCLVEAELSSMDAVDEMLNEIDNFGMDIDFVFNNAGVQIAYRVEYLKTPVSDYEISFMINTIAPMKICYHFLPKMLKRNFGRIVNTTSGIDKDPQQAGYSASKAALDKVTKDIGPKLKNTNVMISLFDPGWCRTDLGGQQAPNDVKGTIPGSALGAFLDDGINGRIIRGQEYSGMDIVEAVDKLQKTRCE